MARSTERVVQCLVGLRLDQVSELERFEQQMNASRSELIRAAVDEWLKRHSSTGGLGNEQGI